MDGVGEHEIFGRVGGGISLRGAKERVVEERRVLQFESGGLVDFGLRITCHAAVRYLESEVLEVRYYGIEEREEVNNDDLIEKVLALQLTDQGGIEKLRDLGEGLTVVGAGEALGDVSEVWHVQEPHVGCAFGDDGIDDTGEINGRLDDGLLGSLGRSRCADLLGDGEVEEDVVGPSIDHDKLVRAKSLIDGEIGVELLGDRDRGLQLEVGVSISAGVMPYSGLHGDAGSTLSVAEAAGGEEWCTKASLKRRYEEISVGARQILNKELGRIGGEFPATELGFGEPLIGAGVQQAISECDEL